MNKIITWTAIIIISATLPALILYLSLLIPERKGILRSNEDLIPLSDKVIASGGWYKLSFEFGIFSIILLSASGVICILMDIIAKEDASFILTSLETVPEEERLDLIRKLALEYNIHPKDVRDFYKEQQETLESGESEAPADRNHGTNLCGGEDCLEMAREKNMKSFSLAYLSTATIMLLVGYGCVYSAFKMVLSSLFDKQTGQMNFRPMTLKETGDVKAILLGGLIFMGTPTTMFTMFVIGEYMSKYTKKRA